MTSTTLNGFGFDPQRDFSTSRCQVPEKLAFCPEQTPSAAKRSAGTIHVTAFMEVSPAFMGPLRFVRSGTIEPMAEDAFSWTDNNQVIVDPVDAIAVYSTAKGNVVV